MRSQVDSGFSGVVLVALGDTVIWRKAYSSQRDSLHPTDAFWIASMTKGFTAAAVLTLAEQHRLSLADSLAHLLPGTPPDKGGITIRQLLTHTAGLAGNYSGGGIAGRAEAVRAILAPPLGHPPGTAYRYGDDDYELLAAIVEVVSHRTWEDYLQRTLLNPLALHHTGFWCRRRRGAPVPVRGADGAQSRCGSGAPGLDDWGHRGANGMSSTVDDLFRWARALAAPGRLSPAIRQAISSPQVFVRQEDSTDISYSYGARIYARAGRIIEVMLSGSGDDGHTGIVRMLSSGITVIVLSNAGLHRGTTWSSFVAQRLVARD